MLVIDEQELLTNIKHALDGRVKRENGKLLFPNLTFASPDMNKLYYELDTVMADAILETDIEQR